ncbi:glycosyltransferase [Streptococcus mitis]|uniref:glycosyltransferase n=1 Tax=Streptococcus mitis TaxID=28037 RepID=UPI0020007CA9|nr:glycosyltransferase [Streptococcus mitis]
MNNITLSIIIPVYNVEAYLRRCLDSILKQNTLVDYEIILINDGSTDSSGRICDDFQSHFSNIQVKHIKNSGVAAARNLGISLSNGKLLYFVDPDDYLAEDFFIELAPYINDNWDILCFGFNEVKEKDMATISCRTHRYTKIGKLTHEEFINSFIDFFRTDMMYNVWSRIYKKDFILEHGIEFPKKSIGEDTLFNFQVYKYLETIRFIEPCLYNYIAGRSGSALTEFNPDRIEIQLNELDELKQLLKKFNIEDYTLLKEIKTKIIVSSTFQISNLENTKNYRVELLKNIIENEQFDEIFSGEVYQIIGSYGDLLKNKKFSLLFRRLTIELLARKKFRTVLFIEKLKMNPILRKIAFK